jgi:hypothetical protein
MQTRIQCGAYTQYPPDPRSDTKLCVNALTSADECASKVIRRIRGSVFVSSGKRLFVPWRAIDVRSTVRRAIHAQRRHRVVMAGDGLLTDPAACCVIHA